jgi:hypothetical protein
VVQRLGAGQEIVDKLAVALFWHKWLYPIYGGFIFISHSQSIEPSVHHFLGQIGEKNAF